MLSRDAGFAMDGSHIPIPAPPGRDMAAYFNYKGFYSVILLAIVDNAGLFRWICVGPPGSSGDAGVWKWCKLSKEIVADQLLPELHRKIIFRGRYILGDSAFANSDWLLTPFDAPSTRFQRFFNYKHSQTRFIVEHAFGRLKRKFMCLKNRMYFKIEKVPGVVQTCVALYNFILVHEGVGKNEAFVDDHKTRRSRGSRSTQSAAEAGGSRDRECAYLAGKFLLETWGAEGSALDRARLSAERRHRQCPNEECAEGEPVVLPC